MITREISKSEFFAIFGNENYSMKSIVTKVTEHLTEILSTYQQKLRRFSFQLNFITCRELLSLFCYLIEAGLYFKQTYEGIKNCQFLEAAVRKFSEIGALKNFAELTEIVPLF